MSDSLLMFRKEWKCFVKSDRGVFFIYCVLIVMWSMLISVNSDFSDGDINYIWLVFFSVIVSGNFSNTTFISERMVGSLEILLTSGLSRKSILMGKILFVVCMAAILGILCYSLAFGMYTFTHKGFNPSLFFITRFIRDVAIYVSACYLSTTCSAWLSFKISNPRLTHFINFFISGFIVMVYAVLSKSFFLSFWYLSLTFILCGICFTLGAMREFKSERVIQPIIL